MDTTIRRKVIHMDAKRGYIPDDDHNFSLEAIQKLKTASCHISYLINEGYDLKSASTFVGNHFLLSERQRLAIARSAATAQQIQERTEKKKNIADLCGQTVWIDGFNEIITLEVMYSHSLLFQCMDGTIRDLAALRGTYRMVQETDQAIRMMLKILQKSGAVGASILLDEPVSNSGRLKTRIAEIGEEYSVDLDIWIIRDVDKTLYDKDNVITSDSVILDHCHSWLNLTEVAVQEINADVLQVW